MPERKALKFAYLGLAIVAIAAMALALVISNNSQLGGFSKLLSILSGGSLLAALIVRIVMIADVARKSFKKKAQRAD